MKKYKQLTSDERYTIACLKNQGSSYDVIARTLGRHRSAIYREIARNSLALGIPERYFTSLFTCSRVFGWISHFLEFNRDPRLIRPRALYGGR